MSNEITQINLSGNRIGIIGLQGVFEAVQRLNLKEDNRCKHEILCRVKQQNYISCNTEENYAEALWREFRRWRGEHVEEELTGGLIIKVLGPGCYSCDKLMETLKDVLTEMNIAAELEHVHDAKKIQQYGLVALPALVINNNVKGSGRVPNKMQLKDIILTEHKKSEID